MVSLHRKRTLTKTEVSVRECDIDIAVISLIPEYLTFFFFFRIVNRFWNFGLEKPLNIKSSVEHSVESQKMRMLRSVRRTMEACLVSQGSK